MRKTIAVAGSLAQRPHHGGHAWVFLQYLLGFERDGWDVVFVDWVDAGMCVDERGRPARPAHSANVAHVAEVMRGFGLGDRWCVLDRSTGEGIGLSRAEVTERLRGSALLLNVMGFLDDDDLLAAAPCSAFLDIDPGFGQMWRELGLHDLFVRHDAYVTIGENIGSPACTIPTGGIDWVTTKQPVVLDEWPVAPGPGDRFTTVASWRGPFGPIEFEGRTYGLRVHEFRRFLDLPARTGAAFELALDIDEAEVDDLRRLRDGGWTLVDPREAAGDPWRYRRYVAGSAAELMIAKNLYVQARSGWFSDRSICYLASGRPVLAQDTGLDGLVPSGEGLLLFDTPEEAAAGAAEILGDPVRHGRAARAIAEEHFASGVVLPRLLGRLGVA